MDEPMQDEQMQQGPEATPEEQAMHDQYVREAMKPVAANGNVWQGMLKTIRAGRSRLADTIATIAAKLYALAEKKIGPLDDDDISEAVGESIIENILIAASSAGIISENEITEDLAVEAYLKMAQQWIESNPERADPEDLKMLAADRQARQQGSQQQAPQQQPNILGGAQ